MRKITKIKRSVKAISPVISVLLMIAIAVVASLVAYAWVMGYIGGKTTQTGNAIQIQSVSYTTPGNLTLYVQNTGQGLVHLKQDGSVYVNDVLHQITQSPAVLGSNETNLSPGQLIPVDVGQTVQLVIDCPYHSGDKIKVVTVEGTYMETTGTGSSSSNGGSGQNYQVSFVLGSGGASMSPTGTQTYAAGSSVPLTATAASGYQFSGWSNTGTITFDSASSASTNAHIGSAGTITANFVQIQSGQNYQVQFVLGTGGTSMTPTGTQSYASGSSVPINALAASGYQFSSWTSTGTITFDSATSTSTNAHIGSAGSITANFVAVNTGQNYQVTFNLGTGGSSMSPTGTQSYTGGATVPVTATPSAGYQFSSWTSTGTITFDSVSSASTNAHIGSDGTITANFVQTQSGQNYQVSFVLGSGGASMSPTGTQTYAAGSSVPLTATAAGGYQFSSWTFSGLIQIANAVQSSTTATINGAGTITANFISTTGNKLVFTQGTSQTLVVYEPSAKITVQRQNSAGTPITSSSSSLTINLATTSSGGKFYSDAACTHQITTSSPLTIGRSASSVDFYYRDSNTGTPTITASASSYQPVSTTFTISAATPEIGLTTGFDGTPWDSEWRSWPNPPWSSTTDPYYSAPSSATSVSSNQGAFSSNKVDATGAAYITVSFYFRITGTDPTDFQIRYSGTASDNYNNVVWTNLGVNLGDRNVYTANEWHYYSINITDTSAFTSYFRFQFLSQSLSSNAQIWVDNVQIVVNK